jgi:GNAT superfamily N-acetyltransferase
MNITEVISKKDKRDFLEVPKILYKNNKDWTCPLDNEINKIFTPEQNIFYTHGEAIRFLLKDEKGKLIGRIASFINRNKAYTNDQPTGGCGFFECINDQEAAFLLFNTAKKWLKERGMEAMDGPINFGENDNHWGLLVDGYMKQGMGMPYNHAYYKDFFYNYGFKLYFEQYSYHRNIKEPLQERFKKIATWVTKKPEYDFRHFTYKNKDQFIDDLISIYTKAWQFHDNFTPLEKETVTEIMDDAKLILEEEFVWFAYHNNKPIAFFVMMPDLNQALRHINGKLDLFSKLKLFYLLKRNVITRARITVMGITPEFQGKGVESAIFLKLYNIVRSKDHYTELELSWVGDFNPKMQSIYEAVGGIKMKTHQTLRYLFNKNAAFKRYPIINSEEKK